MTILEIWGLLVAGFLVLGIFVQVWIWATSPSHPVEPPPEGYTVTITDVGRTGHVTYHEADRSCSFGWEIGGTDVVLFIVVPTEDDWASAVPWAPTRRQEILERIADEGRRQQCQTCRWEIDADTILYRLAPRGRK